MKPLVAAVPTPEVIDALRTRAEQGHDGAQVSLGVMYANGTGVPQDDVQAHLWYSLVASRETGVARTTAVRGRDRVEDRMTPDGVVKLPMRARFSWWALRACARSAGARHRIPDAEGARSQQTVVNSAEQMSADSKEILYDAVHGREAL
tara:strand:+ start:603 stop:1049 length:447 start_codon:yes stop_codon:yes gene_type:complete